jgi:hypothetical protein
MARTAEKLVRAKGGCLQFARGRAGCSSAVLDGLFVFDVGFDVEVCLPLFSLIRA